MPAYAGDMKHDEVVKANVERKARLLTARRTTLRRKRVRRVQISVIFQPVPVQWSRYILRPLQA